MTSTQNKIPKPSHWGILLKWALSLLLVVLIACFIRNRVKAMNATSGYFLPVSATDWAAWGTWVGGLATAAAFLYTLAQLRKQRAQEIARDYRELERHKVLAKLVRVDATNTKKGEFFGSLKRKSAKSHLFKGEEYTYTVENVGPHAITDLTICFDRTYAAPPQDTEKAPLITDPTKPGMGIVAPPHTRVGLPTHPFVSDLEANIANARMLKLEALPPDIKESFTVVFPPGEGHTVPHWISFTDASGYKWYRNYRIADLSLDPDTVLKNLTSRQS